MTQQTNGQTKQRTFKVFSNCRKKRAQNRVSIREMRQLFWRRVWRRLSCAQTCSDLQFVCFATIAIAGRRFATRGVARNATPSQAAETCCATRVPRKTARQEGSSQTRKSSGRAPSVACVARLESKARAFATSFLPRKQRN